MNLRYGLREINDEVYNITISKLKDDKLTLTEELKRSQNISSNSSGFINEATLIYSNIGNLWEKADYNLKKKIQKLVFPNDLIFDKKKWQPRTENENEVFGLIRKISDSYKNKKRINQNFLSDLSAVVEITGLEPVTSTLPVSRSSQMS